MKESGIAWFERSNTQAIIEMLQTEVLVDRKSTVVLMDEVLKLVEAAPEPTDRRYPLYESACRCLSAMEHQVLPDAPGLPHWCYLMAVGVVLRAERREEWGVASHWTFWCGMLWGELDAKWRWQAPAAHGQKRLNSLEESRTLHNAARAMAADKEHAEWQAAANEIWQRRPKLTHSAMARRLANDFPRSAETIRKHIKKPGQAG